MSQSNLFSIGQYSSGFLLDNGQEKASITHSTLKHETTITTNSVLNEEGLIQKTYHSLDDEVSLYEQRDISRIGVDQIKQSNKKNSSELPIQPQLDQTARLQYFDFFKLPENSSDEQTFIRNQSKHRIFQQSEPNQTSRLLEKLEDNNLFLENNMFDLQEMENQALMDLTQLKNDKKYINIMNDLNMQNFILEGHEIKNESLNHSSWNDETMLKILHQEDKSSDLEDPLSVHPNNLKNLANYIRGDISHCTICSSKFEEQTNKPRVLFCGDSLCEECIRRSIVRFKSPIMDSLAEVKEQAEIVKQNLKEVLCPICVRLHTFKLISNGFVICDDKFVKIRDEHGYVNYYGDLVQHQEVDLKNSIEIIGKLDCPLELEDDLVIRCIPANIELLELIKEKSSWQQQQNLVKQICKKFFPFEHLSNNEVIQCIQELRDICEDEPQPAPKQENLAQANQKPAGFPHLKFTQPDFMLKKQQLTSSPYQIPADMMKNIQEKFSNLKGEDKKQKNQFKKTNEELPQKFKQILEKQKKQAMFQPRQQSKTIIKQTVQAFNPHFSHQHHHHHTCCGNSATLHLLSSNSNFNMLSRKHQKFLKHNHHFGPGNHAHFVHSKKDEVDDDECGDEEGLDEREPEKAICGEKTVFGAATGIQKLSFSEIYRQQIEQLQTEQLNQQQAANNNQSQKKNKRKKKRQKAKQVKQEQKILFKNGVQLDDQNDTDLWCMMVPPEMEISTIRQGDIVKQPSRNMFQEYLPNENIYEIKKVTSTAKSIAAADNLNSFQLLCDSCSGHCMLQPDFPKMSAYGTQQTQLAKLQAQMTKELIDAGLVTVTSHLCTECTVGGELGSQPLALCLLCSLSHKQKHPNHQLKQVLSKVHMQVLSKRNPQFEKILNFLVAERVRDGIDREISKLCSTMNQVFKIAKNNQSLNKNH